MNVLMRNSKSDKRARELPYILEPCTGWRPSEGVADTGLSHRKRGKAAWSGWGRTTSNTRLWWARSRQAPQCCAVAVSLDGELPWTPGCRSPVRPSPRVAAGTSRRRLRRDMVKRLGCQVEGGLSDARAIKQGTPGERAGAARCCDSQGRPP
jgi:hypothetical protein